MDSDNWRPAEGGGEPTMDTADWRSQLPPEFRQRVVNKIMETLKMHLPFSGQEGLLELKKIANRFEERIYTAATNQSDYLDKISLKMLNIETKTQNTIASSTGNGSNPHTGSQAISSQIGNQGQSLPIQNDMANQVQARQPLLSQNNMAAHGVQGSVSLASVGGAPPTSMAHVVGQNLNLQNIQSMFGVSQNSPGNPLGQMPGRQQQAVPQQQQQSQNQQCYLYQQQNIILNMHLQQQLGPQSNVAGLQQQLIANHSGNSSMQTKKPSLNLLGQSKVPLQIQTQQGSATLLLNQGQQSEPQLPQQQLLSQAQSQPRQLQRQLGLQQQPNSHRNMNQRLQAPGSLLQPQNMTDQQKQLFQLQRPIGEVSSASLDSTTQTGNVNDGDWQEDVYQKIKAMKEAYLPELNEMYQKIADKLQQHDSLPRQPNNEQLEKLKIFKSTMERIMTFLQVPKSSISLCYKDKLCSYEKHIVRFLNSNRPRKPASAATAQQNNVTGPQQNKMYSLSGPPNASLGMLNSIQQVAPNMLQQQNIKQQDHQMPQNQQLKQHLPPQMMKQHQQQMHQQTKQLQNAQLQENQMMQMQHMNNGNDMHLRHQMSFKSGAFQQHHTVNQRSAYHHQQLNPGAPFPQIDQEILTSLTKAGTPFQSASSLFIVPCPSTPLAPSPMRWESEKVNSGVSALSNTGIPRTAHSVNPAQSPGISASPLLAEFSSSEGDQGHTSAVVSGKSILEKPLERLIEAVKSMSPKALSASVSDIGSVVSMIDRIAESAPGNGSRAAVGEDLVAMMNCRQQARNFTLQDGNNGTKRMRRYTSAMPLNVVPAAGSGNDNFKYFPGSETSDFGSLLQYPT